MVYYSISLLLLLIFKRAITKQSDQLNDTKLYHNQTHSVKIYARTMPPLSIFKYLHLEWFVFRLVFEAPSYACYVTTKPLNCRKRLDSFQNLFVNQLIVNLQSCFTIKLLLLFIVIFIKKLLWKNRRGCNVFVDIVDISITFHIYYNKC